MDENILEIPSLLLQHSAMIKWSLLAGKYLKT